MTKAAAAAPLTLLLRPWRGKLLKLLRLKWTRGLRGPQAGCRSTIWTQVLMRKVRTFPPEVYMKVPAQQWSSEHAAAPYWQLHITVIRFNPHLSRLSYIIWGFEGLNEVLKLECRGKRDVLMVAYLPHPPPYSDCSEAPRVDCWQLLLLLPAT